MVSRVVLMDDIGKRVGFCFDEGCPLMTTSGTVTLAINDCLQRLEAGDSQAEHELIDLAYERLAALTGRMLGMMVSDRKGIRTSDVFQESYLRLRQALSKENVQPKTSGAFMGLAARHIRFQILDMLRAAQRQPKEAVADVPVLPMAAAQSEMWICFYEAFDALQEDEREVADLLWTWVEGKESPAIPHLTQYEAAEVLGISRDRVKDLWRRARLKIARKCQGHHPHDES